ncbi:MAG: hypothetical protein GX601_12760, partial [Anaerolineales bacterium]|nr:hypothetical protein [Anaerolineales bacterium]
HEILDDGTPMTQRAALDFVGFDLADDDYGDATIVTLPDGAYAETVGDGVEVTYDVEHGLDTTDVVVQVWDLDATPITLVSPSVYVVDADTVRVTFGSAPDTDQMRVVVVKGGGGGDGGGGFSWDYQTLTDQASIAWDLADGNAQVTLAGNRTLANPTNLTAGALYWLRVIQDGAGGRELTFGSAYRFTDRLLPAMTTVPGSQDVLLFACDGSHMYLLDVARNLGEMLYVYNDVGAFEWTKPDGVTSVTVLVVGGGGGGGDRIAGGGGAGGVVLDTNYDVSGVASVIGSVGAGGVGFVGTTNTPGGDGGDSTFGTITALGGGGGGSYNGDGQDGGSGGGGGGYNGTSAGEATDTDPPNELYQGCDGGTSTGDYAGGGGGGAGEAGADGDGATDIGGDGGDGVDMSSYFGTGVGDDGWFGGGGGGAGYHYTDGDIASGGKGGGGAGGHRSFSPTSGLPNTGGGGGGRERFGDRSDGGSGVVIIKPN